MKYIIVAAAVLVCVLAESYYTEKYPGRYGEKYPGQYEQMDKYTDKYDGMDIDEVLSNKRLLNSYSKCVLDKGKCTAEGKELKNHITDALQNGCAKCTDRQRYGMRKVIKHYITNEKGTWDQMVEKYDPKRVYTTKYERELRSL